MYQYISEQSIYQYFGEDDPEMIKEMVEIILTTNIKDLKQLQNLHQQGEFTTIKKRCHKAKPSMNYIGALKTRKIIEDIESGQEDFSELNTLLHIHLSNIETELHQFLKSIN
ncbi:Hpt domain-containing protein [Algoriphagus sp.]|uniref:Hpt domain-containing protein n=1 Tax=Algoriphagus sp. TaxID=1872435 RepID=UPI0032872D59